MNAKQRKLISELVTQLETLNQQITDLAEEERDKWENLSEGLQGTERGQAIEDASTALDNVSSTLEDAINELDSLL